MTEEPTNLQYVPDGLRLTEFLLASNFVDVIQGPVGSGKSKACCVRIMRHAQEQRPSTLDGLRKSRWAIVRNTYPDLKRTTMRTWRETFPETTHGRINMGQPPSQIIRFPWNGGDVVLEIDFLALDRPEDENKLKSAEYTGIWFNELRYIERSIFDEARSRVRRYPAKSEGGPTWTGVIADTNAPDEDHWLAQITGQVGMPPGITPEEAKKYRWPEDEEFPWRFYLQPPAMFDILDQHGTPTGRYRLNPNAENLRWLQDGYYPAQITGQERSWIESRILNKVTLVIDGAAVWPMFRVETHVSNEVLRPIENNDVVIGLDFGRSPAAVFMQAVNNRVLVQHELTGHNEGAVTFAPKVKRFLVEHYPNYKFRVYGDPKGQDKTQTDNRTAYDVFRANGIPVMPPPGLKQNMIETRVDAVTMVLNEMYDGRPRFVLSPLCPTLKVAMAGRYHNERDEQGELRPCKDRYSNPADALQYGILGLGEGRRMIGLTAATQHRVVTVKRSGGTKRRVA